MTYVSHEARSCTSKAPYESRSFAARDAKRLQRERGGGRTVPYHCRYCGWWHVGHSVPKHIRRRSRS